MYFELKTLQRIKKGSFPKSEVTNKSYKNFMFRGEKSCEDEIY